MARSNGEILLGQIYDRELDLVIPFTEQMMHDSAAGALQGSPQTEIAPQDGNASRVRIYDAELDLSSLVVSYTGYINVNLPDVLTGITVTYNSTAGSGVDQREVGDLVWEGTSGSFSLNPTARAQGSAAIIPDVSTPIVQTWGQNIPAMTYAFYMDGNFTQAQLLARMKTLLTNSVESVTLGSVLMDSGPHGMSVGQEFQFSALSGVLGALAINTTYYVRSVVSDMTFTYSTTLGGAQATTHSATGGNLAPVVKPWPVFKPKSITLTLNGANLSVSQNAESSLQYVWSPSTELYAITPGAGTVSSGYSIETGVTVRTVNIPPTLHPALTLSGATNTEDFTVSVKANIPAVTGTGDAPSISAITNEPTPITGTVNASVTPASIAATSGYTAIPTANLYIADIVTRPYAYGWQRVLVQLVDFSIFA